MIDFIIKLEDMLKFSGHEDWEIVYMPDLDGYILKLDEDTIFLPYEFIDELIGVIFSVNKICKPLSVCPNKKVLYLSTHSKKHRTRKKNIHRAIKILQEIPMS